MEEPIDLVFPLNHETEEQKHLVKALQVLCWVRGHPDLLIMLEGRDEIGTAKCQWERSSLETAGGRA